MFLLWRCLHQKSVDIKSDVFFVEQILERPKAKKTRVDVFCRTNLFTTCEPSSRQTNPGSISTNIFYSDSSKRLNRFIYKKIFVFHVQNCLTFETVTKNVVGKIATSSRILFRRKTFPSGVVEVAGSRSLSLETALFNDVASSMATANLAA